ncbi:MAG: hotdog fold thioesterase [Planctomycetaceae bacterium]|nr:hotdog fold thioesterase [Planctomycetaceae bacterium]
MRFELSEEMKSCPFLERVLERDRFTALVGIQIEEVRHDYAKVSLVIEQKHLNGVDIAQGGAVFTLADYAFALASNTGEKVAVGIETSISFMRPTREGEKLFAVAEKLFSSKSLASFLVSVTNQDDQLVAQFLARAFLRS